MFIASDIYSPKHPWDMLCKIASDNWIEKKTTTAHDRGKKKRKTGNTQRNEFTSLIKL